MIISQDEKTVFERVAACLAEAAQHVERLEAELRTARARVVQLEKYTSELEDHVFQLQQMQSRAVEGQG